MTRVQAALAGALPQLMEHSRFAQHGAALQMTPEQLEAFRPPLRGGVAETLTQEVLKYMETRSRGTAEVNHNMLFQDLKKTHEQVFSQLLRARQARSSKTGRQGPTWVQIIVEVYVNPQLLVSADGGQLNVKENTIGWNLMDSKDFGPWAGNALDCPAQSFPDHFEVCNVEARTPQAVYAAWKKDEENERHQAWGQDQPRNNTHRAGTKRCMEATQPATGSNSSKKRKSFPTKH